MNHKISGYINFYYDFTFLEDILFGLNDIIDELIFVDGPYDYCVENLKKFNLYYDEQTKPNELINILNSSKLNYKIKYFYNCWKDEKEKRMFGYEQCSFENILLIDADEFYCIDKINLNNFLNNDIYWIAGFEIFNMHRVNQYFDKSHKNILFKKKYFNSHQHLSYTWLMGVKDLEPKNNNVVYYGKFIGTIYHQTLNRNKMGNIIKYIFYCSLYNFTNNISLDKLISFYNLEMLKYLSIDELYDIFFHCRIESINMANVTTKTFFKLNDIKINLSKYNNNHSHGYFEKKIKLLRDTNFFFYLNNVLIVDNKLDILLDLINVEQIKVKIHEIKNENPNYTHNTSVSKYSDNIYFVNAILSNEFTECIIEINCKTINGDIYILNNIRKNLKNVKFEKIIPFGEECYTCQSIDTKFNKKSDIKREGFPFDYVGHVYLDKIIYKINNFGMLSNKNIVSKLLNNNLDSPYFLVDNECDFRYWHDDYSEQSIFSDVLMNKFLSKYNIRYQRLFNLLNSEKKILIWTVQHFDKIFKNENRKNILIDAYNNLKIKNKNIYVLGINYCDYDFNYENLIHVYIEYNKELSFEKTKEDFQEKLYSFINDNL